MISNNITADIASTEFRHFSSLYSHCEWSLASLLAGNNWATFPKLGNFWEKWATLGHLFTNFWATFGYFIGNLWKGLIWESWYNFGTICQNIWAPLVACHMPLLGAQCAKPCRFTIGNLKTCTQRGCVVWCNWRLNRKPFKCKEKYLQEVSYYYSF